MRTSLISACFTATAIAATSVPASAFQARPVGTATEQRVQVGSASLYVRDIGNGPAVIVLHGGPDFDQSYLLPELDRLASAFHLIYYDQRGRGKSADGVQPSDVSLASDVDDIDRVRQLFHLDRAIILGHSWGVVLALEYALRYPTHVSRLILMNPAPASHADYLTLRAAYAKKLGSDFDREKAMIASAAYQAGDPATVTARYRIHFEAGLARSGDLEKLMARMDSAFKRQGSAGIIKARAVEDRLVADSWARDGYDLMPRAHAIKIPTLVLSSDRDFIPPAIAEHIATAIPNARLASLKNCGHFSYMECPDDVRSAVLAFYR